MNEPIKVGDRVSWEQRPGRTLSEIMTGNVRDLREWDGWHYALIETDPDGRLTMPSLDKLTKLAPAQEVTP